jgi:Transposase DDE domain
MKFIVGTIRVAQEDLGGFGDARLRRVGARLLEAMGEQPTACVQALSQDRNEALAFGRFLDHNSVSHDEMLTVTGQFTGQRAAGRHVLAIQDTTEFNFPGHTASKSGFGRSGNDRDLGLFLHPTIAIDASHGGIIGLVGMQVINRTAPKLEDKQPREIEEKESYRWLLAAEEAADVLSLAASITIVADRESDIYEQFARRPQNVHLLTRAAQDRCLTETGRLFATIDAWHEQHRETITLPAQPGRRERTACLSLRFGAVSLRRPATADKGLATHVDLFVVDVVEVDAPAGIEALHWRLLTTHAVTTVEQAQQVVSWYRQRWNIEQVFRTLKSAAVQVDDSQVTLARRFIKLAVVGLIAAVRIMQIVNARDGRTEQSIADVIDPAHGPALQALNRRLEGRTEKLKNPHPPENLAWFSWIVARLGGWSGYTSRGYKPAGPKTIARGITRLDGFIGGWSLAIHSADVRLP